MQKFFNLNFTMDNSNSLLKCFLLREFFGKKIKNEEQKMKQN